MGGGEAPVDELFCVGVAIRELDGGNGLPSLGGMGLSEEVCGVLIFAFGVGSVCVSCFLGGT